MIAALVVGGFLVYDKVVQADRHDVPVPSQVVVPNAPDADIDVPNPLR